jgi:hypothetical protein
MSQKLKLVEAIAPITIAQSNNALIIQRFILGWQINHPVVENFHYGLDTLKAPILQAKKLERKLERGDDLNEDMVVGRQFVLGHEARV